MKNVRMKKLYIVPPLSFKAQIKGRPNVNMCIC